MICQVIKSLPENLKLKNQSKIVQTIGLNWDTETDEFVFNVENEIPEKVTKRIVLADLMTLIFDTRGLTGPIKTKLKILMQWLWLLGEG